MPHLPKPPKKTHRFAVVRAVKTRGRQKGNLRILVLVDTEAEVVQAIKRYLDPQAEMECAEVEWMLWGWVLVRHWRPVETMDLPRLDPKRGYTATEILALTKDQERPVLNRYKNGEVLVQCWVITKDPQGVEHKTEWKVRCHPKYLED